MNEPAGLSRRTTLAAIAAAAASLAGRPAPARAEEDSQAAPAPPETQDLNVHVDLGQDAGALDHIWSRCAGSDRASITLRQEWRHDLERFHNEAGLERVRFHGILDDDLGVWPGGKQINFQNVDAVYDGLLELGVRPFVELSFMPRKLAGGSNRFGLYAADITPPRSMADWSAFIQTFVRHLVARYGATEVRTWYFEIWNEPNLSYFWSGDQAQYFALYAATAAAVKSIDAAMRVGGPATAEAEWIPAFLDYCGKTGAPVDFVSTHIYPGDDQTKLFGAPAKYNENDVIAAVMAQVRSQIDATPFKGAELWLSEWSSDSPAMIAHVIAGCLPHCHAMSQWAMSSVFEEIMVAPWIIKEGDNGWGMLARRGIAKPEFNTYKLLNRLGQTRLASTGPALATRTEHGVAVLVWNLADVNEPSGIPGASIVRKVSGASKPLTLRLAGARPSQALKLSIVDQNRGSPYPAWRALGSPQYPDAAQLARIRAGAELAPPEDRRLDERGELVLNLLPEAVALIELDRT